MKVKFMFDSDLCWHTENIVELQDNLLEEDVEAMFPVVLNVPYNKNDCRYVAIDGHIFSTEEIMAYTE